MGQYRIELVDDFNNEVLLTVTTSEDLIAINNSGWMDCWLDVNAPKVRWSKIMAVWQVKNEMVEQIKTRINRYIKPKGKVNKDNKIKPGEPNFNNKTNK